MIEPVDSLQSHRFIIDKPSSSAMKKLRTLLPEFSSDLKLIRGLAFFGSRTKGRNKVDSDLDLCVFYDGSKFGPEILTDSDATKASLDIDPVTGDVRIDPDRLALSVSRTRDRLKYERKIKEKYRETLSIELGLPPERLDDQNSWILMIDISKMATDNVLDEFYKTADIIDNGINTAYTPFFKLLSRFFLGVGNDLYKNRSYILESLEKRQDGEKLFRILMNQLSEFEKYKSRDNVPFTGYPKTIVEGKKYFFVKAS